MDIFSIHAAPLERRFPCPFPVDTIGYLPHKKDWVRQAFNSYNFSFILNGGGEYWLRGKLWPVTAPCVITQSPGIRVEYGPAGAWTEWEELYLMYGKTVLPALVYAGLVRKDIPAWRIYDPGPTRERLAELIAAAQQPADPVYADRLDRACERLIMESILAASHHPLAKEQQIIRRIQEFVKEHYLEDLDFNRLAARYGLSRSSFRRHWEKQVELPPARYVMNLRMQTACRLLVETRLSVGEIAAKLAFQDALYFSRKFHQAIGITATAYRKKHQAPLSLASMNLPAAHV